MNKIELLHTTHQKFLNMGLCILPMDGLEEIVSAEYMGFGTTADERMFSLTDLRNLIIRQKEQTTGMEISYDIKNIYNRLSSNELSAYFADDITVNIKMSDDDIQIPLRFSCMYEYMDNKWMAVHSHGSKPENVATEEDTWGIEEWKQKNLELEALVKERTAELEKSLSNLKSTQAQLIQKEKLASLGELTAGIAHEIQNPLNFVNNFSELSVGIAEDLKEELKNSHLTPDGGIVIEDTVYFNELISDLSQNQEKINYHGKRASSIVKGMLEHSRMGTGEQVLTDINALCDEYLRLSYHGMRAKNKDFNSDYKTDFDENLPKINIVPQEIGRVLLNLMNNAFYTVHERAKQGESGYQAKVTVSTRAEKNHLEIRVQDNGMGIPDHVKAKIFQPFFTTKPTGEGTGLGLSLAYDIITKGHGGTIEVESVEGATFVVKLPIA
ncbi:MAG: ATP-binding protein [Spirosomataceae bacterium]